MKLPILFGIAMVGAFLCQIDVQGQQSEDLAAPQLAGAYKIVEEERHGQKISVDKLKHVDVRIGEGTITTFDKDKKEVYAATYTLDKKSKPWKITLTTTRTPTHGEGTKAQGLIGADGDTVKLIYAISGDAPIEFKTTDKQLMFVMKRVVD